MAHRFTAGVDDSDAFNVSASFDADESALLDALLRVDASAVDDVVAMHTSSHHLSVPRDATVNSRIQRQSDSVEVEGMSTLTGSAARQRSLVLFAPKLEDDSEETRVLRRRASEEESAAEAFANTLAATRPSQRVRTPPQLTETVVVVDDPVFCGSSRRHSPQRLALPTPSSKTDVGGASVVRVPVLRPPTPEVLLCAEPRLTNTTGLPIPPAASTTVSTTRRPLLPAPSPTNRPRYPRDKGSNPASVAALQSDNSGSYSYSYSSYSSSFSSSSSSSSSDADDDRVNDAQGGRRRVPATSDQRQRRMPPMNRRDAPQQTAVETTASLVPPSALHDMAAERQRAEASEFRRKLLQPPPPHASTAALEQRTASVAADAPTRCVVDAVVAAPLSSPPSQSPQPPVTSNINTNTNTNNSVSGNHANSAYAAEPPRLPDFPPPPPRKAKTRCFC